jgi:hypothetical protein
MIPINGSRRRRRVADRSSLNAQAKGLTNVVNPPGFRRIPTGERLHAVDTAPCNPPKEQPAAKRFFAIRPGESLR